MRALLERLDLLANPFVSLLERLDLLALLLVVLLERLQTFHKTGEGPANRSATPNVLLSTHNIVNTNTRRAAVTRQVFFLIRSEDKAVLVLITWGVATLH